MYRGQSHLLVTKRFFKSKSKESGKILKCSESTLIILMLDYKVAEGKVFSPWIVSCMPVGYPRNFFIKLFSRSSLLVSLQEP